ncbi:MAG: radical SAM protein [bacterium]
MMKVWLAYPPRHFWPYISADDNFLVPQALPCLAAAAREAGYEVRVIDCSPMKIGWKSLAKELSDAKPDVVGVSESHALYANESLRLLRLIKEVLPGTKTVAGGLHFSNLVEETLGSSPVDFIVRMEGEETFVELLGGIEGGGNCDEIRGVAFRKNGLVVQTPPRPLINDLDSLPMPAYDLMPMDKYGTSRFLFSPGGTTIHHSRGCVSNCSFCAWWIQMADVQQREGELFYKPRWRTKSVDRVMEEIGVLAGRYGKRCLVFVDEFWNKDAAWNDEFAEKMVASGEKVQWFAFMRVDAVLRDERTGIFEKLVRSGLCHVAIGVERSENMELRKIGKPFYTDDATRECFRMLREKYPGVFTQGTFIVGVRDETRESMLMQVRYARELRLDYPGFHPMTPVPGTALWREAKQKGWIEVNDFSYYDWLTPVMGSDHLTREEIARLVPELSRRYVSLGWFLKGIFSRSSYKRNMYIWWLLVTVRQAADSLRSFVLPFPSKVRTITGLVKPRWYDS